MSDYAVKEHEVEVALDHPEVSGTVSVQAPSLIQPKEMCRNLKKLARGLVSIPKYLVEKLICASLLLLQIVIAIGTCMVLEGTVNDEQIIDMSEIVIDKKSAEEVVDGNGTQISTKITLEALSPTEQKDKKQVRQAGFMLLMPMVIITAAGHPKGTLENPTHKVISKIYAMLVLMSFGMSMVLQVLRLVLPRSRGMVDKLMWVVLVVPASTQFTLTVSSLIHMVAL